MKPSTTIRVALKSWGKDGLNDYRETVRRLYEVGYDTLDFFFGYQNSSDYILRGDDWQKKIGDIAEMAAKYGIRFSQAHLPYVHTQQFSTDPVFKQAGYMDYFKECVRRAYVASGMLGVRYITAHPLSSPENNYEEAAQLRLNHEFYDPYIELGIKQGVGTAYENMLPSLSREFPDRYCMHYEQLIRLVDSYQDPMVAICWDTGHANMMRFDQARALRSIGHRLKSVHINDNHYGKRDEHLLPFMGEIDWYSVIDAMAEIGYDGDMTFETPLVGSGVPEPWQQNYLELTYKNGCHMQALFEKAKETRLNQEK